ITAVVEARGRKDATLSLHVAMVGRSRESSSPKVFLCSDDLQTQMDVRDAILASGIMNEHPSIVLEVCSNPPQHLVRDDSPLDGLRSEPPAPATMDGEAVWAADAREVFGRALYVLNRGDGPPRSATGGPIIFAGSKPYQIAVG